MKLTITFSVSTIMFLWFISYSAILWNYQIMHFIIKDTGQNMIPWYALFLARSLYLMTIDIEWAAHNFKGKTEDKEMVVTIFRKKLLRFCEKVNVLFQFAIHICLLFSQIVTHLLGQSSAQWFYEPLATHSRLTSYAIIK